METIRLERAGPVARVTLHRPEVRNAFDDRVIRDLTHAFEELADDPCARVVVLAGAGPVFCAGADVGWMRASAQLAELENLQEARRMNAMLRAIEDCPRPVVARVHGAALGGGLGLVAASDIAVAAEGTRFAFSEAKLGILPAVISSFVLPKIGEAQARRWFLTGERFDAATALRIGLVHEVVPEPQLDARVGAIVAEILTCGPEAVREAKRLIAHVRGLPREQTMEYCARTIARVRASPEGQEGLRAFLEKTKPSWSAGSA